MIGFSLIAVRISQVPIFLIQNITSEVHNSNFPRCCDENITVSTAYYSAQVAAESTGSTETNELFWRR